MRIVFLMVVPDEVVPFEVSTYFRSYTPEQEGSERISLHEAVEKLADLVRLPDEFPLDGRKDEVAVLDCI